MPSSLKVRSQRALVALLALTTTTVATSSRVATASVDFASLSITKTDGVDTVAAGGSLTYTIVVTNTGKVDTNGATVTDILPAALTGSWTCAGASGGICPSSGSGDIHATVDLPVGASVTFTVNAVVSAQATGTLTNFASVRVTYPPSAYIEWSTGDVDIIVPPTFTDLAITKTDGVASTTPGGALTYTITATNAGPSNAVGSTITDILPAALTASWTCAGAGGGSCLGSGAGSGNINATVNLPAGASVTFTVHAVVSAAAAGTVSNTATVTAPSGVTDQNPANNSATDTDTITQAPGADLGIAKALVGTLEAGANATYQLTVTNFGSGAMTDPITVIDALPATLTYVSASGVGWSCGHSAGTITCTTNDDLAGGTSSVITVVAFVAPTATGTIVNTATVDAGGTAVDSSPANDSATASGSIAPRIPRAGADSARLATWALLLIGLGLLSSFAARRRATTRQ